VGKKDKDYGPTIVAQMLGVCIGSYIGHGVTKREFVKLAADMYTGIAKDLRRQGIEPGFDLREPKND